MRLSNENWKAASPGRVAWGAYLLLDDALHEGINRAAGGAEGRLGIGRKALANSIAGAGTIATCAVLSKEPMVAGFFAPVAMFALFVYSRIMDRAMDAKASGGVLAQNVESVLLKAARLPSLAFGLFKLGQAYFSGGADAIAYGIYFSSLAVAAYICAGSSGMLDRAREWIGELGQGQKPAEVPIRYR